jgi:hypothetical protein
MHDALFKYFNLQERLDAYNAEYDKDIKEIVDAEKLTAELVSQKEKVLEGLAKADEADVVAGERRGKILAASSMEELDKLQKEYGL